VAIKSIGQIVRTAQEAELDSPALYEMAEGYFLIVEGLEITADRPTLERVVGALENLQGRVYALYRGLVDQARTAAASQSASSSTIEIEKTNPAQLAKRPPNNNYKPTYHLTVSTSSEQSSSEFDGERYPTAPDAKGGPPGEIRMPTVKPKEVVALAPGLATYLSEDLDRVDMQRAILGVIRATETFAFKELSISKPLWAEAQRVLGLWPATLAVMLVAAKDPDYFSRTPAHYFAGMIERAKQGTLRLDRSIWGLRTRTEKTSGRA
jgi:replication initiation protein RepC